MPPAIRIGQDQLSGQDVCLPLASRMQGLYVIGKQGMGKSNFLLTQIAQDLAAGYGVCVLDPHGDLIVDSLALIPAHREHYVVLLDLQDTAHPFAFDLFAGVDPSDPSSLASGEERVVGIFKKVWGDSSWGPRLEDLLANSVHTLLSNPGTTLADLPKLLTDAAYRRRLVKNVATPIVREYWEIEYDALSPRGQAGVYAPLMNKLRAFLRHPVLSRIVSQSGTTVDFGQILARSQVLLVRLNAELEEATSLIGTAVVLRLLEAALGRKHIAVSQRSPFLLYADEFQRFATPTFGKLLEEARKYAVGTILAHQHRGQLASSYLQSAVKGAINLVCFQLQYDDAREMSREFTTKTKQPVALPTTGNSVLAAPNPLAWFQQNRHLNPDINRAADAVLALLPGMSVHKDHNKYFTQPEFLELVGRNLRYYVENDVKMDRARFFYGIHSYSVYKEFNDLTGDDFYNVVTNHLANIVLMLRDEFRR